MNQASKPRSTIPVLESPLEPRPGPLHQIRGVSVGIVVCMLDGARTFHNGLSNTITNITGLM